ncbi:hypothetical protein M3Y99_01882600 [Aphelenchoides fujianensis]|nr:hypothetical protein M3Y99_01882600 [Aphelenchoides fujianensis]
MEEADNFTTAVVSDSQKARPLFRYELNGRLQCGEFERPLKNHVGEWKCVPDAASDTLDHYCPIHPCQHFRRRCVEATTCFSDPCHPCTARFFDSSLDEVCTKQSEKKPSSE